MVQILQVVKLIYKTLEVQFTTENGKVDTYKFEPQVSAIGEEDAEQEDPFKMTESEGEEGGETDQIAIEDQDTFTMEIDSIYDDNVTYEGVEVLDELLQQNGVNSLVIERASNDEVVIQPQISLNSEKKLSFPLTELADVKVLEKQLGNPNSNVRKTILELLVGTNAHTRGYKYAVRSFFRTCFEYSVMAHYCWHGNEKKKSLYLLKNTMEFFKSSVKKWYPTWDGKDYIICVRNFVKNCPARQDKKNWQRRDT